MTTPADTLRAAAQQALNSLAGLADVLTEGEHATIAYALRQVLGTPTTDPAPTFNRMPCSLATLHRPHPPHTWEPQPGMTPLACPGTPASAPAAPADRYRAAWLNARHRANVLSAELTRRAPLLGEYAAEIERLRAERTELIRQRDQIAMDTIKALPTPADWATVLREATDALEALPVPDASPGWALGAAWALDQIRRLADEAQPTELGTVTADQPDEADAVETVCKCGHPRKRHTLLSGTYAHCRWTYTEAGRGKCFCGMYRPTADQAATAVTEALCGNTVGVSGLYYRPCARPAGHPEAYCRDATGDHLFLPATAEDDDPICGDQYDDETCELEPEHAGAHCAGILCWDYGRAPATAATEEPQP